LFITLHRDRHIQILDKPFGVPVIPARDGGPSVATETGLRVCHRLDRDTSGVMVFALTPHAQRHLGLQFEKRMTKKTYVARVWGEMTERTGTVDLPLIVDWPNRPLQKVDSSEGRAAVTDWRVVRVAGGETRVRLMPKTGRSHQLRVHMREIGHPILGDPFYATGPALAYPRLMLHSETLQFRHPDGGKGLRFTSKAPF